ncbi:MAG: flagellar biosynthetic protein FliQ [Methyloligellaceae bacterium]
MENELLISQLYTILFNVAVFAGPPLLVATLLGLLISIIQAVTQIQDQSLPQTVKITVIAFIMISFGAALAAPFFQSSQHLFEEFPNWVR